MLLLTQLQRHNALISYLLFDMIAISYSNSCMSEQQYNGRGTYLQVIGFIIAPIGINDTSDHVGE